MSNAKGRKYTKGAKITHKRYPKGARSNQMAPTYPNGATETRQGANGTMMLVTDTTEMSHIVIPDQDSRLHVYQRNRFCSWAVRRNEAFEYR